MQVTGTLKVKTDVQQVSDRLKKREFVITDNSSQYPQHIIFALVQDRCDLIDKYNPGDTITVHYNLRGREWTSPKGEVKYFNTLEAWRIEGSTKISDSPAAGYPTPSVVAHKDDLPF